MTDLLQTIAGMASALRDARKVAIEDAVWALEDDLPEAGIALHAIMSAKRIHDCATNDKTIAVVVWPEGASLTIEAKGDVPLRDLLKLPSGGGE